MDPAWSGRGGGGGGVQIFLGAPIFSESNDLFLGNDNFLGKKIFRTSTLQLLSSDFTRPSTCSITAKSCLT